MEKLMAVAVRPFKGIPLELQSILYVNERGNFQTPQINPTSRKTHILPILRVAISC